MAEKITMQPDGTLSVPDEPIIPFIEGDGTGVDIWPAAKLVMDAAAKSTASTSSGERSSPARRRSTRPATGSRMRPSRSFATT